VKQLLVALLRATAREKAAKAKQEGLKKQLRPVFDTEYFKLSHQMQSFLKTVCINDQCNYSAPNVGVAAIQGSTPAELKQALAAMKEKLVKLLGQERYAKHIKSTSTLVVNTTPENMALLRTKLTAEEFVQFFTYIPGLDLTTEKEGSDSIVCLKRDMSIDPAVEALVRQGVKEGLLTLTEGAVAPQKSALAVVEQEILKEQKAADEAVAAKTAGQVAGAVTGAVVEAAVATAVKL
jgi:hypothetical protein